MRPDICEGFVKVDVHAGATGGEVRGDRFAQPIRGCRRGYGAELGELARVAGSALGHATFDRLQADGRDRTTRELVEQRGRDPRLSD
jgi:hypothetical protein